MYRIYTQDVNRTGIESILAANHEDYTMINGTGAYQGIPEDSLIIELFSDDSSKAHSIAEEIRTTNHQDAVAMYHEPVTVELVTGQPTMVERKTA